MAGQIVGRNSVQGAAILRSAKIPSGESIPGAVSETTIWIAPKSDVRPSGKLLRILPANCGLGLIGIVLALVCATSLRGQQQSPLNRREYRPGELMTAGWHRILGASLRPQCPSNEAIQGTTGCRAVIEAWNGGVADTKRDQLIFWGGGHTDYYGNEVYALDLRKGVITRLTGPSPVTNVNDCPEAYVDGNPSSRHTYGGLVYVPSEDAMFTFGGSKASCGSMSTAIWRFKIGEKKWTSMERRRGDSLYYTPGITADFDAPTETVIVSDRQDLFRYDPQKNELKRVGRLPEVDYHLTGVIDPAHRLFLMIGYPGQFWAVEIDPRRKYAVHDWARGVHGCEKLLRAPYPGLAYDAKRNVIVGWMGGDSVVLFDATQRKCEEQAYPDGPGPAHETGTSGRFRYFPSLDLFALIYDWNDEAYILRLAPPSPTPEKTSN